MREIIRVRLALAVLGVAILGVTGCGTGSEKKAAPADAPKMPDKPPVPVKTPAPDTSAKADPLDAPDFSITAEALAKDYLANEKATHAKYGSKPVRVTGTVRGTGSSLDLFKVFLTGDGTISVCCTFPKPGPVQQKAMQLKAGQKVTLQGLCIGVALNKESVDVVNCQFAEQGQAGRVLLPRGGPDGLAVSAVTCKAKVLQEGST